MLHHIIPKPPLLETLRSLLNNQQTRRTLTQVASNEYGHPMAGNDDGITGTSTMSPITLEHIPQGRVITYGTMVCDHRPLRKEPNRCRLVVS